MRGLRKLTEVCSASCWGEQAQQRLFAENQSYAGALEALSRVGLRRHHAFECASTGEMDFELIGTTIGEDKKVAVGVVDHRNLHVESPDQIAALLRRALEHIAPERLLVSSDFGFGREGMTRRIAFYKMVALVRGANIVRAELGFPEAECRAADSRYAWDAASPRRPDRLSGVLLGAPPSRRGYKRDRRMGWATLALALSLVTVGCGGAAKPAARPHVRGPWRCRRRARLRHAVRSRAKFRDRHRFGRQLAVHGEWRSRRGAGFSAREACGGRLEVVAELDGAPQAILPLDREVVEFGQNVIWAHLGARRPYPIAHPGSPRRLVPVRDQLVTTDGVRLITIVVTSVPAGGVARSGLRRAWPGPTSGRASLCRPGPGVTGRGRLHIDPERGGY